MILKRVLKLIALTVMLLVIYCLLVTALYSNYKEYYASAANSALEAKLDVHRKLPLIPPDDLVFVKECKRDLVSDGRNKKRTFDPEKPILYIITPTYTRREQVVELIRMSHTLLLTQQNIVWIVAEDSKECSMLVKNMLEGFDIPYVQLASPMPSIYEKEKYKPRGVAARRAGMNWVLENHNGDKKGIIYFADDDNTYDLKLFDELAKTESVSVFPVGFVGQKNKPGVSSPIVKEGKVVGFSDGWFASRVYPIDMAGFAIEVDFLASKENASMPYWAGYEEDILLQTMDITFDDLQPLANNCKEVLVWHTKTVSEKVPSVKFTTRSKYDKASNLRQLVNDLVYKGMAKYSDRSTNELKQCIGGGQCGQQKNA